MEAQSPAALERLVDQHVKVQGPTLLEACQAAEAKSQLFLGLQGNGEFSAKVLIPVVEWEAVKAAMKKAIEDD